MLAGRIWGEPVEGRVRGRGKSKTPVETGVWWGKFVAGDDV